MGTLDAAHEPTGVLHLHVGPLGSDAHRPAPVLRPVQPAVQRRDGARVLEQVAPVPETSFAVEAEIVRRELLLERQGELENQWLELIANQDSSRLH